ncbi:uncharacterized protein LOC134671933 isoform X3 [Cydia fagiglandana]|uniref:uncharacterized protein LOC134671754 isoform X3 n=1 Tax=Cydia fagiglandana TaxID=1458189 RepID=UPI002FEE31EB
MPRKCCIPGCDSSSERKDVMLHKMPAASEKVLLWRKTISAVPLTIFEGLTSGEISKLHVCHNHFEAKYVSSKMRLRPNACPTLFTLEEITTGKPAHSSAERVHRFLRGIVKMDTTSSLVLYAELLKWTRLQVFPVDAAAEMFILLFLHGSMELESMGNSDHSYARKCHYDHTYAMSAATNESKDAVLVPSHITTVAHTADVSLESMSPIAGLSIEASHVNSERVSSADQASIAVVDPSLEQTPPQTELARASGVQEQNTRMERTPKWTCRKRLRVVSHADQLSPECEALYKHYKKAKKQVDYFRRAKMASKLSKEASFKQLVAGMNSVARKFLWMQIKLCTASKKGRRFSLEEKVIALSIMKQSPKCYRFLQRIFILPCKTTLNKLLLNVNIEAGINTQVFNVIKQEVCKWNEAKRMCSIIFDEMKLEAGVHYSRKHDNINGFVELSEKTNHLADHALAFMIKGAVYKWQQPMAYYFSEGAASGPQMKAIIKEIVAAVCETGLQPIALISDQGTSFQSAFKSLQEDTRRSQIIAGQETDDTIHLNGQSLSVLYDPPHLIKGVRNNFLTKDILMEGKVSKWQDLVDVYRTDCGHAQARLLHKLNDEHILPEKIKKMKVKNCVRVFSQTMAGALSYTASFSHYADGTPVSATLANTAELVAFLDDLFDSVNGASTHHKHTKGKKLRTAVTENSEHHVFWAKAIPIIENMKLIDHNGKLTTVPSLRNWVTTLKSFQRLWQVMKDKNIKIMRPRYFNSDAIENFFGRVRAYNARNNDPTCHAFECTFKSLLITNFIKFHENTYNCEEDCAEQVIKIQSLFSHTEETRTMDENTAIPVDSAPSSFLTSNDREDGAEQLLVQATRERLDVHSRAYTAGWVTRKVLKILACKNCEKDLTTEETDIHKWISKREYNVIKKNKLTYPSEHAVRIFGNIVEKSNEYLEHSAHKSNIKKQISQILMSKYSFDFIKCEIHRDLARQTFMSVSLTLSIFNWCNTINKILKGTDVSRLNIKNLPLMQAQAYKKYKKRFRNK